MGSNSMVAVVLFYAAGVAVDVGVGFAETREVVVGSSQVAANNTT